MRWLTSSRRPGGAAEVRWRAPADLSRRLGRPARFALHGERRLDVPHEDCSIVGLAISTIGRPSLRELLRSAAVSTEHPLAVAIADHTPSGDLSIDGPFPFRALVVPSAGGASTGRNDAARALPPEVRLLGFPNDDNTLPPTTLAAVAEAFSAAGPGLAAVACTLLEDGRPRFALPPDGQVLDRLTVWRAIEPATFVRRSWFDAVGGFPEHMGTGAGTPWQAGDGTEMLLQIMAMGGRVESRRSIAVCGPGERKGLSASAHVAKHRAYARGTGYVYRTNGYPLHQRIIFLLAPLVKAGSQDPSLVVSVRLGLARFTGRLEGLLGRTLPGSRDHRWL